MADVFCVAFTVTGPVARFARQIAGQGYICAAPSSYHEFTGPEPLKYDAEDTDKGNAWKIGKVSSLYILFSNYPTWISLTLQGVGYPPRTLPHLIHSIDHELNC
jgi:hypothetical protein